MYSTDVVKENAYLSATRSGLESNEIATLQRSLPSRFNLRHLKKNESLKLVLQKKAGKSRVVAYKFTSGSFNYTAYRISDKKFYNLSDTSGKGSLDYPLPATARLSSPFNPARLNPVSGKVSPHNGIDYSMPMNTCQRQDYWPFFAIFNVRYWSLMLSAFRHFIITDWRGVFCQHSRFAFFL